MSVDLGYAGAEIGTDEEFPALDFGLDYDEGEVGFRVHVAGHLLDELDLRLDFGEGTVDEVVAGPAVRIMVSHDIELEVAESSRGRNELRIVVNTHGKSSAAPRSFTQTLVRACRSASPEFCLSGS